MCIRDRLRHWDRATLLTMAEQARQVAIPDATERVALEVARAAK
ncbi:UDP-N-acetylglucosamine--N-acetylmuramyl-(pentapeptide) pyrophosphoryl-undecaprenol N-acetylglucosamine transferase, partial [Pantoea allii]